MSLKLIKQAKAKMTAQGAVDKMIAERGYVVVGLRPETKCGAGYDTGEFAGQLLLRGRLVLYKPTSRKDWQEQVIAIFGDAKYDKNPIERGQRFFRCRFEAHK